MAFTQLKIGTRLALGFGLLLSLLVLIAGLAGWQMSRLAANTDYYDINLVPSFQVQNRIAIALGNIRRTEFRHVLSTSAADMSALEQRIAGYRQTVDESFDAYAKTFVSDDEDRRDMETARAAVNTYYAEWEKVLPVSRATTSDPSKLADATKLLVGSSADAYEAAHTAVASWWDYNVKLSKDQAVESRGIYSLAKEHMMILAAMALAFALTTAFLITRGLLAELGGEPAYAKSVMQRIADGDLTMTVATRSGDQSSLLAAMQAMHQSLVRIVTDVRSNSESVASTSTQIAQGNMDLSKRTEEQATALEETAATMEELSTTVQNNAENSKEAKRLAESASEIAAKGGGVMRQVVESMRDINDGSKKIVDITSVVDSIAFQTNLLALNAAVEAARAGEQGRGFAVVAAEVRLLAQRSADAAREIKQLISLSEERVQQGSMLVDQAGQTMNDVVDSIRRVSEVVTAISTASVEQSNGVSQIGQAVSQMDLTTQQNAALVEEGAAAAESLQQQALHLQSLVGTFRLVQGEGASRSERRVEPKTAPVAVPARTHARLSVVRGVESTPASSLPKTGTDDWRGF